MWFPGIHLMLQIRHSQVALLKGQAAGQLLSLMTGLSATHMKQLLFSNMKDEGILALLSFPLRLQ